MAQSGKSEDNLIEWIRSKCAAVDASVSIGIGDDMAMLRADGDVLFTADMLMDGVHFDTAAHSPEQIGRKALAVGLSDCAAMAVRPRWALLSVALPNTWTMEQAQGLYVGIESLAKQYDVRVIGGDTNSWDRPLVIDVTVIAEPWSGVKPVTRSGMRPGDALYVTGQLGGSRAGHHLSFMPRVHEARQLAEKLGNDLHAMIDLSDGLSTDAGRMAKASGCGMEYDEHALLQIASDAAKGMVGSAHPTKGKAGSAHPTGMTVLDHVLNDGEDFELLFAATDQRNSDREGMTMHRIGRAIEQAGVWLRRKDGSQCEIVPRGWQHFR